MRAGKNCLSRMRLHILAFGLLVAGAEGQRAVPQGVATPLRREVLALTNTSQADRSGGVVDHVHDLLQTPLNYLGINVREHDVYGGPPRQIDLRRYRAVLIYLQAPYDAPAWVLPWLEENVERFQLRVVQFGDLEPLIGAADDRGQERLGEWLARFGLGYDGAFVGDPRRIEVRLRDPELCSFESTVTHNRTHAGPWNTADDNRPWVTTVDRDGFGPMRTPVITGPWGGLALHPWALYQGRFDGETRWHIDPFRFFEEALGLQRVPAPDPNVVNGRRMFILHVDGDGFENLSTVQDGELSAKVMLDQVLDRYRLPATVSVIVASLTDDLRPGQASAKMALAREILNRDFVEPASHAVLHPLSWRPDPSAPPAAPLAVSYPSIRPYRPSAVNEVRESIRFINEELLDGDRRCRVMLWSGAANPTEAALDAATSLGCWNLNGGVFRFDRLHNSIAQVSPWGRAVGQSFQVYCGSANENVFDGFFTNMPAAFGHVDDTLQNTQDPRILKPADLYIHFYSAERPARLQALHQLIQRWALREPTAPVFASSYAAAVQSAQSSCRIYAIPGGWEFEAFDGCRTVRFAGEYRAIDWQHSSGILGQHSIGNARYIHLAAADARLIWAPHRRARPFVEQANHELRLRRRTADSITVESRALVPPLIVFGGFPPSATVSIETDSEINTGRSDDRGRVRFELPAPHATTVKVALR